MQKYRLKWTGEGALDLSQVLDEHGMPITFPRTGTAVIVHKASFQHPLVQRYLRTGLVADKLSSVADTSKPPLAPPPTPPKAEPPLPVKERKEQERRAIDWIPKRPHTPHTSKEAHPKENEEEDKDNRRAIVEPTNTTIDEPETDADTTEE